ncbi:MAG: NAD(P)H-dependent glycerol-3-phosphate dehydrogenase [Alphaproteobacteria bacterium]
MNICVIGAGAWGTALAISAANSGNNVTLWTFDGNYKIFDGVNMPVNLQISRELSDAKNADLWLLVTPAEFFRETLKQASVFYNGCPVIICTKGAENQTGKFMSEILNDVLPNCSACGVLSGPQFAAEVASGIPTGSTLAGNNIIHHAGQKALSNLELSFTDDVIGTQLCGIGKNAVALIFGYNSVKARGENERALIFTKAWNEIIEIGLKMGAKLRTFSDLCGIGDLFLSATSMTSRNCSGGASLARGEEIQGTVEGVFALNGLIERGKKLNVPTPTLSEMKIKMGL